MKVQAASPGLSRRAWLLAAAGGLGIAAAPGSARATSPPLPFAASLLAELEAALAARRALLVMASLEGCPWCRLVRESWLAPLRAEGQPVVELDMRRALPVVDFRGVASTHAQVAQLLRVRVAPTVLFIGAGGAEVAPRLAGVPLPDFYGAYLQERIMAANRSIA